MSDAYSFIEFDTAPRQISSKSGIEHIDLTDALSCSEFHARVWFLDPGDALSFHRQRTQEELYIPIDCAGQLRIRDNIVQVPRHSAVKVPPETKRQIRNESEDSQTWIVVGAPAVSGDGIICTDADLAEDGANKLGSN